MYISNIKKFLRAENLSSVTQKTCMKEMMGPLGLACIGILVCSLLKGYFFIIAFSLIVIVALNMIITYKISSLYVITLRICMMLKLVLYITYVFVLSLIELLFFLMWKGFHISFLLLYSPIVIIPLFMMLQNYKRLNRNVEYEPPRPSKTSKGVIGFATGLLGVHIGKLFINTDQATVLIVAMICASLINCVMSMGLVYIQKLYLAQKYEIEFEDN